jgi:dienelactone hydrolase
MFTARLLAGILLAMTLLCTRVQAGQFVEFDNSVESPNRVRLIGYLARPNGTGPFPAVVVLHGCGGFHASMLSWADRLALLGYVALAVDSFGPRGIDVRCGGFAEQSADSYAALRYLTNQTFVVPARVAVMGFSMGGTSVLADVEKGSIEQLYGHKFRAGIAMYPSCSGTSGIMAVPVLVLAGQADDWTPASECEAMAAGQSDIGIARQPGDRLSLQLIVYPGTHHGFDIVDLSLRPSFGTTFQGHRIEYNEAATKDSISQVRSFLQRTLSP